MTRLLDQIAIDFFQELIYLLIRQMVLAPVLFESFLEHIRIGEKKPSRGKPLRGFQLSGRLFNVIEGTRPASIGCRARTSARPPRFSRQGSDSLLA